MKTYHCGAFQRILKDKTKLNIIKTRKMINERLKKEWVFDGYKIHYLNIKCKIIAEEYLENKNKDLYDYKAFCFDNRVNIIEEIKLWNLFFYVLNMNKLKYTFYANDENVVPELKNWMNQ